MSTKEVKKSNVIKIDAIKLCDDVKKSKVDKRSLMKVSKEVLGRSTSYLGQCKRYRSIDLKDLKILCETYNLNLIREALKDPQVAKAIEKSNAKKEDTPIFKKKIEPVRPIKPDNAKVYAPRDEDETVSINSIELKADLVKKCGASFSSNKISKFILNKSETYLRKSFENGRIKYGHLETLCEFYELRPAESYILEDSKPSEDGKSMNQKDYENLVVYLSSIDKSLSTLVATMRTQNYILSEMKENEKSMAKIVKELHESLK